MITTERLLLRPCRKADKPVFARILNTPGMMAELGGMRSDADIDALVDKRIADQAKHGHSYWAVELRSTRELIGTCGLRIADNYLGTLVHGIYELVGASRSTIGVNAWHKRRPKLASRGLGPKRRHRASAPGRRSAMNAP